MDKETAERLLKSWEKFSDEELIALDRSVYAMLCKAINEHLPVEIQRFSAELALINMALRNRKKARNP